MLCAMFMTREIEASLALRKHIAINVTDKVITWELPVSKADPKALGCKRSWGCSCWDAKHVREGCPYHTALAHIAILQEWFGDDGEGDEAQPLFPGADGLAVSSDVMLAVIEELARMTGENILTHDGRRKYGKHSWRSTGAVFMTSIGIEIFKVQLMWRWACAVVTHYTRLAP